MNFIKALLEEMRIHHYIKNILVFAPLCFSLNLLQKDLFLKTIWVFISFCAVSSAIYFINDIADVAKDRLHPIKKNRPIASGRISVSVGIASAVVLFFGAFFFALSLNIPTLLIVLLYFIMNICYSFYIKHIPILDVFCIAMGFVFRVLSGGLATGIEISQWLLLTIMALSFFLGFGKRRNEMKMMDQLDTRKVLAAYHVDFLDRAMYAMLSLTIAFYSLWSIDDTVVSHLGTDKVFWTVPVVVVGLFRYALIIENNLEHGDPTSVILHDKGLLLVIFVYLIFVFAIMYYPRMAGFLQMI